MTTYCFIIGSIDILYKQYLETALWDTFALNSQVDILLKLSFIYLGTFTSQTDVWSFGVTVWEIFTFATEQPFDRLSDEQVIENALSLAERPGVSFQYLSQPQGCPNDTFAVLMNCWKTVPEERLSFQELLSFFKARSPNSMEVSI